jgi:hypothetical protein
MRTLCCLLAACSVHCATQRGTPDAYNPEPLRAEAQEAIDANDLKRARQLLRHELSDLRQKARKLPAVPQESVDETSAVYLRLGRDVAAGVANVLGDLGGVYQRLGQEIEGLAAMEDAADILRAAFGESDPRYGMAADRYADALVQNGQQAEALPVYRKLLKSMQTGLGVSHPAYQLTLSKMAHAAADAGKHASAIKSYSEILGYIDGAIAESADHIDEKASSAQGAGAGAGQQQAEPEAASDSAASVRVQYARALAHAGRLHEALAEGERAHRAYSKSHTSAGSLDHAMASNGLAGVLERIGRDQEAVSRMSEAYQYAKGSPTASKEVIAGARRNLDGLKAHIARKQRKRAQARSTANQDERQAKQEL